MERLVFAYKFLICGPELRQLECGVKLGPDNVRE
jgi:hypothetical protein